MLTLENLANQFRQLNPQLKGVLALVDADNRTLIDLRVDTFENIVAMLDGMGMLHVRRQKRSDTCGKKLREAYSAPKLRFDYTQVAN